MARQADARRRLYWVAILALPLGLLLWLAGARVVAGFMEKRLDRALQQWERDHAALSLAEWRARHEDLRLGLRLTPDNPRLLMQGGQLYIWSAWLQRQDRKQRRAAYDQAIGLQRRAVALRPAWPYDWADLANSKAQARDFDEEFQTAFANAALLGPWETGVQIRLAKLGLVYWGRLNPQNRQRLLENLERALAVQDTQLFATVAREGNLPVLCTLMERHPKVHAYCVERHLY